MVSRPSQIKTNGIIDPYFREGSASACHFWVDSVEYFLKERMRIVGRAATRGVATSPERRAGARRAANTDILTNTMYYDVSR